MSGGGYMDSAVLEVDRILLLALPGGYVLMDN